MTTDTHKDPKKVFSKGYKGSGCCPDDGTSPADQICACLIEALGDLDLSNLAEIVVQLELLCEKLLQLPDYTELFENLCTKLETVVTSLEDLCTKIEESNEELCEKIEGQLEILTTIMELNEQQLECLVELKAQGVDVLACLDIIKASNESQLEVLTSILSKTTATPIIWGDRQDCNWFDNQATGDSFAGLMLSQDEHQVTITMSDGSSTTFTVPAIGPQEYDAQFDSIIASLNAITGKVWELARGAIDGNPATPLARYIKTTCCPGDTYITSATALVIGGKRDGRVLPLLTGYDEGEVQKYKEYDCGPNEPSIWLNADGEILESAPDLKCPALNCAFPDGGSCACPAQKDCSITTAGPLEDCDLSDDEPVTLASGIFMDIEVCDGVTTLFTYTVGDDGLPIEYEVQGELTDADKNIFASEVPCPDIAYEKVQIRRKLNILDNSLWVGAPAVNIGAGPKSPSLEIDVTWTDGSVGRFSWPGGPRFFYAFRDWLIEETGCTYAQVQANWPGRDTILPWGLTEEEVQRDCLYARGWSLNCCAGSKCVESAVIVESSDAAWVGVNKQAWTFEGPLETVYQGHVGCDFYYKDCSGNPLDLPKGCCPVSETGLDEFKSFCESDSIEGADYNGAIAITSGRPLPGATWQLIDNRDFTNQVVVAEGATFQEFTANLEDLGYAEFIEGEIHYVCPCPPGLEQAGQYFVSADGNTVTKPACTPLEKLNNAPPKITEVAQKCALRTIGCNDDRRDDLIASLVDKFCSMQADCVKCAIVSVDPEQTVDNLITGAIGTTGEVKPLTTPVAGPVEFAGALAQLGFQVESVIGNDITVCGAELIIGYQLSDGTIVNATPAPSKQGLLVCDPNAAANTALLETLVTQNSTTIDLLSQLIKCMCAPCQSNVCDVAVSVLNGEGAGAFVPVGDAGPEQNWPAPALNDRNILSGPFAQIQAPYPECAQGTVRVKIAFDHETGGGVYPAGTGGHNGFFVTPSAGAFVSGSETNGVTFTSATSIRVGQAGASPWAVDRGVRCIELEATPAEIAAGITLSYSAFGSVGVGGEILHDVTAEILASPELDCSACSTEEIIKEP